MSTIALDRLRTSGALALADIQSFEFQQIPGRHASGHIKGTMQQQVSESLRKSYERKSIEVLDKETGATIFSGLVDEVVFYELNGYHCADVKLVAGSTLLDNEKKSKSYQNTSLTYEQVILDALNDEPGAVALITDSISSQKIGYPIIRYRETAWEFVGRLASHFGSPVISDVRSSKARIYIGVPDIRTKVQFDDVAYTAGVGAYSPFGGKEEAMTESLSKAQLKYFVVSDENVYSFGSSARFQGTDLFVCAKYGVLDAGMLKLEYLLAPDTYCSVKRRYNPYFAGMTLLGTVIKVAGEDVYLHLDIDASQSASTAYPYPWTPESNNLMYMMPKEGTKVSLYFPDEDEAKGRAVNCLRDNAPDPSASSGGNVYLGPAFYVEGEGGGSGGSSSGAAAAVPAAAGGAMNPAPYANPYDDSGDMTSMDFNPDYKQLVSEHGKKFTLYPQSIGVSAGKNRVTLYESSGAVIGSGGTIAMLAKGDIELSAKNIQAVTKEVMYMAKGKLVEVLYDSNKTKIDFDAKSELLLHFSEEEGLGQVVGTPKIMFAATVRKSNDPWGDDPREYEWMTEGNFGRKVGLTVLIVVAGAVVVTLCIVGGPAGFATAGAWAAKSAAVFGVIGGTALAFVGSQAMSDYARGYASDWGTYAESAIKGFLVGLLSFGTGLLPGVGASLAATMGAAFLSGAGTSLLMQLFEGGEIDWVDVLKSGIIAAAVAGIVWGIQHANMPRRSNQVAGTTPDGPINYQQERQFWRDYVEFEGNRVYQRNDLWDPNTISTWTDRKTGQLVSGNNIERMLAGNAPIGLDGSSINLHHLTQTQYGAIAEVTQSFHQQYKGIIHWNNGQYPSLINRSQFNSWARRYWTQRAQEFLF